MSRTGAVDVAAFGKYLLPPSLACIPCDDSGLDGTEIRNIKLRIGFRYKCSPYQLGECIRNIFVQELNGIKVAGFHKSTGIGQILQMVLRKVLQLNKPACPTTGAVGSIESNYCS